MVFIQIFGIWSCVDGEIARLTKTTSRLGDFYDTMVDRIAEFLIVGTLMLSMYRVVPDVSWGTIFFAYIGLKVGDHNNICVISFFHTRVTAEV